MLDFRYITFLELCRTRNFTKTAEALNITQPAVSQHIKYLQEYYQTKLFFYEGKKLQLTSKGKVLLDFVSTIQADNTKLTELLQSHNSLEVQLNFGATLSIGEYIMPKPIQNLLLDNPTLHINMEVENTETLLSRLREGKLNFALIEGYFDKTKYASTLLMDAEFIGVCSPNSNLINTEFQFENLLDRRLILREKGSGSRDILEQILHEHNLTVENFSSVIEIGNINAIKQLINKDVGITFIYKAAVERALEDGRLSQINIVGLPVYRQFNFVYLKNSQHEKEYLAWFKLIKKYL
ncbi:LysR family transcriptional regulator [Anaerorhabdus sp.]|uniref:LysR family transcriptional regulator n=1 Tax=Anaerorhabdus sp. TaxID=1872524 RepID=UPI002FCBC3A1